MSRFFRGALICLLGLLVAAGAVGSARRLAGEHYLAVANRLAVKKQRADAIAILDLAIAWNPGRSEIALRLGDLYTESYDDLPEATVAKLTERGRAFLGHAISAYLQAIDSEPGDAWAWAGLGGAYARLATCERRSHGIELGRFSTPAPEHFLLAERLALAAVDRALTLEPNSYTYMDERAALLMELGRRKEAIEEVRRSAEIMPRYSFHNWGPIDKIDERLATTIIEGFLAALRTNPMVPRHEVLRQLGEFFGARGGYEAAERYFEQAEAAAPDRRIALIMRFLIGEEQRAQGKVEEAFASYGKATAEPDVAAEARSRRGEILLGRGQADAAFAELRPAVALQPKDPNLRLVLARAAEATGRDDLAAESLEAAAALSPHDPEPVRLLVDFYRTKGRRGQAVEAARRLLEGWPQVADYKRMFSELTGEER